MSHILVVSNDGRGLANTLGVLNRAGYEASGASSFQDATRLVATRPIDLVIADECLGEFNGLHVILKARCKNPDVAAIVTTRTKTRGLETDARSLATALGIDAPDKPNRSLEFGHVEVIVDDNYSVPSASQNETSSASSEDETPSASSLSGSYGYHQSSTDTDTTEPTPDQGAPIDGGGVPCVN